MIPTGVRCRAPGRARGRSQRRKASEIVPSAMPGQSRFGKSIALQRRGFAYRTYVR